MKYFRFFQLSKIQADQAPRSIVCRIEGKEKSKNCFFFFVNEIEIGESEEIYCVVTFQFGIKTLYTNS